MGQTTDLQAAAIEFIQAAESMLVKGDFSQAEKTIKACLKLVPGDKRALALLDRLTRKDALDIQGEISTIIDSVSSEASGPFTTGSGARHGRFLPHEVPDDGKEQAIASARTHESSENWNEAMRSWLEVLSIDPTDTWAWTQYAHLLSVNLKDYDKAEEAYRKALDVDPTDDWAWGKLGIMLADFGGKIDQGQEMLRRAIELDPREAYYKAWLGWSLYNQSEEKEEAVQLLQEAVKLLPSYQWAWFHLGYLLSTMEGRHKESRAAYQKSIKLSSGDVASHFNLGVLYQEVFNQPKQALKCFQKVISLNPDEVASWRRIAFLHRDQFLDPSEAIAAFRKVTELDSEDYEAFTLLGHLLWEEEKDMAGGLEAINHALRLKEGSPWIWCHLGDYYCYGTHDIGSAEVAYREAVEINDSFDWALAHLGALLLDHKNEPEEAEGFLKRAVEISPSYVFALRELVNCKQVLGRSDNEISDLYAKILAAEPDSIDIIIEYAELLGEKLSQPEEGLAKLSAALLEAPDHFYLQWSILHYSIYTLGRAQEAAIVIPALEEYGTEEMSVACLLGYYYAEAEGDYERAGIWYGQAIKLAPDDHFAVHEYGEFLQYHSKDFSMAKEVLTQAALLDNDNCSGIEGDTILSDILVEQTIKGRKQGMAWVSKIMKEQTPLLGTLHTALLLLIAYGEKEAALALSERMVISFPVAAKAWRCRLACLIMTGASAGLIEKAREMALAYKADWLDLDSAVDDIINPLGLDVTGG